MVFPSAKTELASPNGPRTLCHLPLSSTDRHGRLVDYHHQRCQDRHHQSGWTRNQLIISGFPSGNSRCCLRKWIQGGFLSQNGIGRIARTDSSQHPSDMLLPLFLWDDDDRKIEEAVLFVLIKIIFVIIFWARLVLWGGLPVVCERSMGVLWWFGALMDVAA